MSAFSGSAGSGASGDGDVRPFPDLRLDHAGPDVPAGELAAAEAHGAAYVLGALTAQEAAQFKAHLVICTACRRAELEFGQVVAQLPDLVDPVAASPAVKARLLEAVHEELAAEREAATVAASEGQASRRDGAGDALPQPALTERGTGTSVGARLDGRPSFDVPGVAPREPLAPRRAEALLGTGEARMQMVREPQSGVSSSFAGRSGWLQPPRWVAAVLLTTSLALGAGNVALLRQAQAERGRAAVYEAALSTAAGGRVVPLSVQDGGQRPGRVALIEPAVGSAGTGVAGGDRPRLVIADLPELSAERTYQLWLIDGGTPHNAGTFQGNGKGVQTVPVEGDASRAQVVAVTVEPKGGSPAPTSQPILAARL